MRKDIISVTSLLLIFIWMGSWLQGSVNSFAGVLTEDSFFLLNTQQITKFIIIGIILFLSLYLVRAYRTYFLAKISPFLLLTYIVSMDNFAVFNSSNEVFVIETFWKIAISIILIALYIEYQRTYLSIFPRFSVNIFYDNFVDVIFVMSILYFPFLIQSNQLFITNFEIENLYLTIFNLIYFLPIALIILGIPMVVDSRPFYGTFIFKLGIVFFLYLGTYLQAQIYSVRNFSQVFTVYNYFLWIIIIITSAQLFRTTEYKNTDH